MPGPSNGERHARNRVSTNRWSSSWPRADDDIGPTNLTTAHICVRIIVHSTTQHAPVLVIRSLKNGKGDRKIVSPYSIAERRVPELIPVLGSQPAGDLNHKPGGRLPLLTARPAVTVATLKRAATNFAAW